MFFIQIDENYRIYKLSENDMYIVEILDNRVKQNISENNITIKNFDSVIERLIHLPKWCNCEIKFCKQIQGDVFVIDYEILYHKLDIFLEDYDYRIPELKYSEFQEIENDYLKKKEEWLRKHIPRLSNYPNLKIFETITILKHNKMKTTILNDDIINTILRYI